jgi:dipeptidyl aminopeptidase/acylaminoacyl peptidase
MTERTSMDPFEIRLAGLLRRHTQPAVGALDPLATARAAMTATTRGSFLERWWPATVDRRNVRLLIIAGLLVALAVITVFVGAMLTRVPEPARILFVRSGDIFMADEDGSHQTLIAKRLAGDVSTGYIPATWSPDMHYIAAVRDVDPVTSRSRVDILNPVGSVVRAIEVGPSAGPWFAWSPDGSELAIVTSVGNSALIKVIGLDRDLDREIPLPAGWQLLDPATPQLTPAWSPDGQWIALFGLDEYGLVTQQLVAADGSGTLSVGQLVEGPGDSRVSALDWSPDGRRMVVAGELAGCPVRCLGVIDAAGGPLTSRIDASRPELADDGNRETDAESFESTAFSPDGRHIAVASALRAVGSSKVEITLSILDPAAGRLRPLTSGSLLFRDVEAGTELPELTVIGEPVAFGSVAWMPDSRRLVYLVPESGTDPIRWTVRSIAIDGAGPSKALVLGVQSFDLGHVE